MVLNLKYNKDIVIEIDSILEKIKFENWSFLEEKIQNLSRILSMDLNKVADEALDASQSISLKESYNNNYELKSQAEIISEKYKNETQSYFDILMGFYSNVDENLDKLNTLASKIKEDSITPSLIKFQNKSSFIKKYVKRIKDFEMIG